MSSREKFLPLLCMCMIVLEQLPQRMEQALYNFIEVNYVKYDVVVVFLSITSVTDNYYHFL